MSTQDETDAALEAARAATSSALEVAQSAGTGNALVPTGADAAVAVKASMAAAHAQVAHARKAALDKVHSAREAIAAQQAELDRQARALELELKPLQEKLELMQEGIWTMNLYLGRDEEIVQLADGEPAPAGTPIHVRQLVLAMDEESAIDAESNGIDFRRIDAFDEWITSDPAHLNQVLPEARGVVAIMARRTEIDYKDPILNSQLNAKNKHTYWLIRNGERVYRMDTNFNVGTRLVPARNEFTSIFVDRWTKKPLQPGTDAWLKAEKDAGARERHFMRVALILQGLIDRTPVFHPLPKVGVSLLSPEDYDTGHVVLIADDENQITTGRTSFYDWLRSLNQQLRPGMRVMVATRHHDWPSRGRERYNYDHHERIRPPRAESPRSDVAHVIKKHGKAAGEFVFTYPRTVEEWIGSGYDQELRVPSTPASCTIEVDDKFVLPLDLVDVATMRTYLGARLERHAYADMFPTLTKAIEIKEAEAAAEAPFRDLLAGRVAQAEGIDLDAAHAAIDPVITTWKVGARWFRPMSGDPAAEARAAKEILAERARIVAANAGAGDDAAFVAGARREHPDALLVARKKDGTYVVLTPAKRAWVTAANGSPQRGLPQDVWVHQHEYTKTGKPRPTQEWVIPAMHVVSRWVTLSMSEAWSTWKRAARPVDHLSDPELMDAIERIRQRTHQGATLIGIGYDDEGGWWNGNHARKFTVYFHTGPATADAEHLLTVPPGSVRARYLEVQATKDAKGNVDLHWPTHYSAAGGHETSWDRQWRRREGDTFGSRDPESTPVPWSDNSGERMVYVDQDAFAAALVDLEAAKDVGRQRDTLLATVRTLTDGVQESWMNAQVALKRERFMEDFADEGLWAAEEPKVRDAMPRPWNRGAAEAAWDRVRFLVKRLVETGRAPWGLTVAEAVDGLAEPLNRYQGTRESDWSVDRWNRTDTESTLPEDLLALRFPHEPTGTDIAIRKDA
ncbi:hypothetical protein [Cellulosimicrobium sp. Marseille-Q4280]|uniref:hypothetical protein n=1 Tax=Cellulosimicrobium sp. Marseille-Q4280 TaxID=2937992 RepID=UPI002040EBDF|nr:hypothetical protein [Cellulosimicrobium sp. Marseille-Q4280]